MIFTSLRKSLLFKFLTGFFGILLAINSLTIFSYKKDFNSRSENPEFVFVETASCHFILNTVSKAEKKIFSAFESKVKHLLPGDDEFKLHISLSSQNLSTEHLQLTKLKTFSIAQFSTST